MVEEALAAEVEAAAVPLPPLHRQALALAQAAPGS